MTLPTTTTSVLVTDQHGTPVPGAEVAFFVTAGGGRVTYPLAVTNDAGLAATFWALGTGVWSGRQEVTASIPGPDGDVVSFTATAIAFIDKVDGDWQTGEVAADLAKHPAVIVKDATNQPVPGVTLTWRVAAGGGSVPPRSQ